MKPKIVIVGAGFGGLSATQGLRDANAEVIVIDKSNHHVFQPLLYQVATAGLSPAEIAFPIRRILRNQSNAQAVLAEVLSIDRTHRVVQTTNGHYEYDYLILATGARYAYFNHPEWESIAPGLKNLGDATKIRRKILLAFERAETESNPQKRQGLLTFVIVGGGPTGVELAGSIAELSFRALSKDFRKIDPTRTQIILIEAGERILGSFPPTLSKRAQEDLEGMGVKVLTHNRVQKIDSTHVEIQDYLGNIQSLACETVIWAAGVRGSTASTWLQTPTDSSGKIKVDAYLRVFSPPEKIFAIGDTASVIDSQGNTLPGVAPVAIQQGRYLAELITRELNERPPPAPFRYQDKGNLATIGRSSAVADFGWLRLKGFAAWFAWMAIHVFFLIGFKNRFFVMFQWAWSYITFERGARLITPIEHDDPIEKTKLK